MSVSQKLWIVYFFFSRRSVRMLRELSGDQRKRSSGPRLQIAVWPWLVLTWVPDYPSARGVNASVPSGVDSADDCKMFLKMLRVSELWRLWRLYTQRLERLYVAQQQFICLSSGWREQKHNTTSKMRLRWENSCRCWKEANSPTRTQV